MSFDLVYKELGDLGLYQKLVLLLGWGTELYSGLVLINSVFLLYVPDHRCAIPGFQNDSFEVQSDAHQQLINSSIPPSSDGTSRYDKCHIYASSVSGNSAYNTTVANNMKIMPCNAWVYDTSVFRSTLAVKLSMVCDRAILKSSSQMTLFAGFFIGALFSGIASDRFGRKPTIYVSANLLTLVAFSIAWTPSIEVYMFQSACIGFLYSGMYLPTKCLRVHGCIWRPWVSGYVTVFRAKTIRVGSGDGRMEFVGPSKRLYAGQIGNLFWVFGSLIMAGIAYLIRDWSMFQIVCAAPGVLFCFYWLFYPESPRWLFVHGRMQQMKKIVFKAASVNKVTISEEFFDNLPTPKKEKSKLMLLQLFSHKILAVRTIILYIIWIAVCMAYYGLALNSDKLSSQSGVHMYFFLQALADVPAILLVVLLIDRTGRKPMLVGCLLIGGLACIATLFTTVLGGTDTTVATLILALVGKAGAAMSFRVVYQISAEIFPTVVRNAGVGSCSCMARIGGIIAPLVADLDRLVGGKYGKSLPLLVFGSLSVFSGLLALMLPETVRKELPETIKDSIQLGRPN